MASGLDRETPPYADGRRLAQHNLAVVPAEIAREPGLDVDELAIPGYEQRQRKYRKARRLIDAIAGVDGALAKRAKDNEKASFPSGFGGGGRSGKSDPTARAALQDRFPDPAWRVFDELEQAMKHLRRAEAFRRRALAMTDAEGKEQAALALKLAEELEAEPESDDACTNHAKIGDFAERGESPSVPNDCTLCVWCYQFERVHGRPPPRELLRVKRDRGRVFARDIEKALRDSQPQKARQP